jgi:hypothetical protein
VRAQSPAGEVERCPCAGTRLEEQVRERHAGELPSLVGRLSGETPVALGAVENRRERLARQAIQGNEMTQTPGAIGLYTHSRLMFFR